MNHAGAVGVNPKSYDPANIGHPTDSAAGTSRANFAPRTSLPHFSSNGAPRLLSANRIYLRERPAKAAKRYSILIF
jgi:hypothetical protein